MSKLQNDIYLRFKPEKDKLMSTSIIYIKISILNGENEKEQRISN